MNDSEFTASEKRYLEDLRKLPTSVRSRLFGWTIELGTSIGLFAYGLITDQRIFLTLGFLNLLYFAAWRMYGQFRGFGLLHSIYNKQLSAVSGTDAEPPANSDRLEK